MLGGRENVLKACRLDQKKDRRKRIYIIDGDFDFLRGIGKSKLRFLYRIRAYCMENLLISDDSLSEIAIDGGATVSGHGAGGAFNLQAALGGAESALRILFSIYATAYELGSGIKTVRHGVRSFFDSTSGDIRISRQKVIARCKDVLRALCREKSVASVRRTRKMIMERAEKIPLQMSVSGKDCLIPFLSIHMARRFGFRGNESELKMRLARDFTPSVEPYFARRIRQVAGI